MFWTDGGLISGFNQTVEVTIEGRKVPTRSPSPHQKKNEWVLPVSISAGVVGVLIIVVISIVACKKRGETGPESLAPDQGTGLLGQGLV
jgi:hypothetical protein